MLTQELITKTAGLRRVIATGWSTLQEVDQAQDSVVAP